MKEKSTELAAKTYIENIPLINDLLQTVLSDFGVNFINENMHGCIKVGRHKDCIKSP
jgi:hypothetical protein